MGEHVVIPARFNGPPDSGHGGYSCAMAARFVSGPAEVSLRAPVPLETPLDVERNGHGVVLLHGEAVVAEARPATVDLEAPPPLDLEDAEIASRRAAPFLENHPFPTCFACGPEREPGDGLRLFTGPSERDGIFATVWIPDDSLAGGDGRVHPDFVWTALDCPSSAPALHPHGDPPVVLARLAARIDDPPEPGRPHVLQSWQIEQEGRKHHTGVALHDDAGALKAVGRALWIELRRPGD